MFFSRYFIQNRLDKKPLRVQSHIFNRLWNPLPKRASQSASEEGSVTVEAAIVIPILLCAFMGIMMWAKVFLLQQEIETALLETARQIARQEHLLSEQDKEGIGVLVAMPLFQANRNQGDSSEGLELSLFSFTRSEYSEETKEVYLEADYQIKIPMLLFGTWRLPLRISVRQKAWNGYVPAAGDGAQTGEYVYITEHGETYHSDSQCYHLHVTVQETREVEEYYNGGSSYRSCEFCVSGEERQAVLYLTEEGECYHENPACSGLTRTVQYVNYEEVGGRRLCVDCSNKN